MRRVAVPVLVLRFAGPPDAGADPGARSDAPAERREPCAERSSPPGPIARAPAGVNTGIELAQLAHVVGAAGVDLRLDRVFALP